MRIRKIHRIDSPEEPSLLDALRDQQETPAADSDQQRCNSELIAALDRLTVAMRTLFDTAIRTKDLSPIAAYALRRAAQDGGITQMQLARETGSSNSKISHLVSEQLERLLLVSRSRSAKQPHRRLLTATRKGRRLLRSLDDAISHELDVTFGRSEKPGHDRQAIEHAAQTLLSALSDE